MLEVRPRQNLIVTAVRTRVITAFNRSYGSACTLLPLMPTIGVGLHQRVEHRFLGGLDHRLKQRIQRRRRFG